MFSDDLNRKTVTLNSQKPKNRTRFWQKRKPHATIETANHIKTARKIGKCHKNRTKKLAKTTKPQTSDTPPPKGGICEFQGTGSFPEFFSFFLTNVVKEKVVKS